jgi:hypothetical protein
LSGEKVSQAKVKRCYKVLKDIVYGGDTDLWVFAGILLAVLGVKDIGNECPICRSVFSSPKGVYNHLLWGRCREAFINVCAEAHRVSDSVARVVSMKSSRNVIAGNRMFMIYGKSFGSFLCRYRDVACVAENFAKLLGRQT